MTDLKTENGSLSRQQTISIVAWLCRAVDVDPALAVAEIERGGVLADLLLRLIDGQIVKEEPIWEARALVDRLRAEGLRGNDVFEEAARQLSQPDAAGRSRTVRPSTVEQYAKEASALLNQEVTAYGLKAMFGPRPTRASYKGRKE